VLTFDWEEVLVAILYIHCTYRRHSTLLGYHSLIHSFKTRSYNTDIIPYHAVLRTIYEFLLSSLCTTFRYTYSSQWAILHSLRCYLLRIVWLPTRIIGRSSSGLGGQFSAHPSPLPDRESRPSHIQFNIIISVGHPVLIFWWVIFIYFDDTVSKSRYVLANIVWWEKTYTF